MKNNGKGEECQKNLAIFDTSLSINFGFGLTKCMSEF